MKRPRVAFVVPYCGPTMYGGVSTLALAVVGRLRDAFEIDVLTTCATDYETWRNVERPGREWCDGFAIERFPVDAERDRTIFDRLSRQIIDAPEPSLDVQEQWMRAQGPLSGTLLRHLATHGTEYDAVVFFSYLYATTYFGLPLVEDRAILVPLAHDEWPLAFGLWERFFARPRAFVFETDEERLLVQRRFRSQAIDGPIGGIGVEPPPGVDGSRFRARTGIEDPFLLYVGRIDPSKGCAELVDDFTGFRRTSNAFSRLVLIGEQHMDVPASNDVIVMGPGDEATKWDALAACDLFVMPSSYESLSIAVLEAWSQGRSVLVNGRAEPLVGQCRRSGGGLWYIGADEFSVCLDVLDANARRRLGASGRSYAHTWASWSRVCAVYHEVLERVAQG